MKLAITGHTKGIGKALADKFSNHYEVVGYSRTNGYDIGDEVTRNRIVEESKEFEIFINNAYHPIGQTNLLVKLIEEYKGTDKLIINISSKLAYFPSGTVFDGYKLIKEQQNILIKDRFLIGSPRILNVITGLVNTEMARSFDAPKLDVNNFADLIYTLVQYKNIISVQQIVVDVPGLNWKDIKNNVE